jgi:hypothetical protein
MGLDLGGPWPRRIGTVIRVPAVFALTAAKKEARADFEEDLDVG